jgi:hypothetical protein
VVYNFVSYSLRFIILVVFSFLDTFLLLCTIEKQKVPAKKEKKSENDKYYEMEGVVMYRSSMVQCFFQIHQAPAAQKKIIRLL